MLANPHPYTWLALAGRTDVVQFSDTRNCFWWSSEESRVAIPVTLHLKDKCHIDDKIVVVQVFAAADQIHPIATGLLNLSAFFGTADLPTGLPKSAAVPMHSRENTPFGMLGITMQLFNVPPVV